MPRGEKVNLACSIIFFFLLDGNISSPVRHLYLPIFFDDKADIFAASLLVSHCSFSSLILSSIVMIYIYVNLKGWSDGKIYTKRIWFSSTFFIHIYEVFKINI